MAGPNYVWRDLLQIYKACNSLYEQIRREVAPDTIIGLTRGGWIPARFLCDRFAHYTLVQNRKDKKWVVKVRYPNLLCFGLKRYGPLEGGKIELFQRTTSDQNKDLNGKHILVIDDVLDLGASLLYVLQDIKTHFRPAGLYAAVIDYKVGVFDIDPKVRAEKQRERKNYEKAINGLLTHPLYFTNKVKSDAWVIYPWENKEGPLEVFKRFGVDGLRGLEFPAGASKRLVEEELGNYDALQKEARKLNKGH